MTMTKTVDKIICRAARRTEERADDQIRLARLVGADQADDLLRIADRRNLLRLGRAIERGISAEAELAARQVADRGPAVAARLARARARVRAAVMAAVLATPAAEVRS